MSNHVCTHLSRQGDAGHEWRLLQQQELRGIKWHWEGKLCGNERGMSEGEKSQSESTLPLNLGFYILAELKRRISALHQNISSLNQVEGFGGVEFEQEIREAEYNATCEKINWLKDKVKMLDENVETMRTILEVPTELEIELKRRLAELADHLIHKQAQVEALASEKATLLFRLETLSRSVEDQGLMVQSGDFPNNSGTIWLDPVETNDIEIGLGAQSNPKARHAFRYEIDSVRHHMISIVRQLDTIFASGAVFWRRNWIAQACGLFYLFSLHIWVLYILFTRDSDDTGFGALVSLESINKTLGT
ncbi:Golgin candidate 2 [Nymphaea thermarum]|nr:Golgin candidate 2 [Nymphaea thermarum]